MIRHGERRTPADVFASQMMISTAEWNEFHASPPKALSLDKGRWKPPPQDWIMINLDASFLATNRQEGWGCIAQDMLGDVLFSAAGPLANLSTATHAEALALMKAINLAESFGMGRVIFMTDYLTLKQAMETN